MSEAQDCLLDAKCCYLNLMFFHLVERSEPVHIGRVYVSASPQQLLHLVPVPGRAGRQEHAAITEPDPPVLRPRLPRLSESLTVLPPLQLLGSLDQGRVGAGLEGHGDDELALLSLSSLRLTVYGITGSGPELQTRAQAPGQQLLLSTAGSQRA